jgi:hypothetical protein
MFASDVAAAFYASLEKHQTDEGWIQKKEEAWHHNKWFTKDSVDQSLNQWRISLKPEHVSTWLRDFEPKESSQRKRVGIIMAGNIPLVGMHDVICCLVSGFKTQIKLSSEDEILPKYWIEQAIALMPEIADMVVYSDNFKEAEAAIATGSNNSSRYFEYYFRDKPHLLRKNRNSVAILNGNESADSLTKLGHDVFDFFGMGCRNITHLLLPENYSFKPLFDSWQVFQDVLNHNKYANNYNYHKALLLMNLDPHLDNGFLLLKERADIYSPVGMLNYSFYKDIGVAREYIEANHQNIQCVVSEIEDIHGLQFGTSQKTMLWDYADGKDTMKWLRRLA